MENLSQYFIPLLFFIAFVSILITGYLRKAVPVVIKAVGLTAEDKETEEEKVKKTGIQRFRENAGVPLSYILLFGILYHISWVRPYLTHNWALTIIAIVAMIALDLFTGVTPESWEKSPQRKKARFHLNTGLILLLIYIVVSANGWDWGVAKIKGITLTSPVTPSEVGERWNLLWGQHKIPMRVERNGISMKLKYSFNGGPAEIDVKMTADNTYKGQWCQSDGCGNFYITFISPYEARGWWNDPDKQEKKDFKLIKS